jgi:hypothetical protein
MQQREGLGGVAIISGRLGHDREVEHAAALWFLRGRRESLRW